MDKLEATQKVLRFSTSVRNWCEKEEKVFFDDFDDLLLGDGESIIGNGKKALEKFILNYPNT